MSKKTAILPSNRVSVLGPVLQSVFPDGGIHPTLRNPLADGVSPAGQTPTLSRFRLPLQGLFLLVVLHCSAAVAFSQPSRWQQHVKYTMTVDVDAAANRFAGQQRLEYTNNSPDTLKKLFYHLYWNAFQPNSMMDARSRHLGTVLVNGRPDWDSRVEDRIQHLDETEIGYQRVSSLTINGVDQELVLHETILEVRLSRPILPGSRTVINMKFNAQVPLQIRRSGRDAKNGVRFSMSQWYPKLCEYDKDGWHPTPYVAREFYGVWGDYDVKIRIDRNYILGGTGYLQNPQQIGYGYEKPGSTVNRPAGDKLLWHFVAPQVHDFMWAADPDFRHIVRRIDKGPDIHVLHKPGREAEWEEVAEAAVAVYPYITREFGAYPYKQYSFIQGGDGGMEYPMATLLNGPGLGTVFHEWMHTWYQMLLGTDESRYGWMDEGFTEWATDKVQYFYRETVLRKRLQDDPAGLRALDSTQQTLPLFHADNYRGYFYLAASRQEEPLTTHADHFESNFAYGLGSYSKGCVFLSQLGYIVGDQTLGKIMLEYYRLWRYKHPDPDDFIRVAENVSEVQLDWYKEYWINTTKTIDYGIDSLWEEGGKTKIRIKRLGKIPMPIDLVVEYKDGSKELLYAPMYLMFGEKAVEDKTIPRTVFPAWKWTHPTYTFEVDKRITILKSIEIDPSQRMADVSRRNNRLDIPW